MNPEYKEYRFPNIKPFDLKKIFRKSSEEAIQFVAKLLVYDPNVRPKPLAALMDPYFDELRNPSTRLPNGMPLPDLFNFTIGKSTYFFTNIFLIEEINSSPSTVEKLIPTWYK